MTKVTAGPTATELKKRAAAARLAAGNGTPAPPPPVVPPVATPATAASSDKALLTYDEVQARWPGRLCQAGCGARASRALPHPGGGYDYWCIKHVPAT